MDRKLTWTKPPRSLYTFLKEFLTERVENPCRDPCHYEDLEEWLSLELDLDDSDSEHCHFARIAIERKEARKKNDQMIDSIFDGRLF